MSALIGRVVLGRYRVLRLLARGGMGEVYLARSEGSAGFHRPVVVKRVLAQHADDPTIVGLFQREARIMATLRHPNIVAVLDFGKDQGDHIMVIEYVHGFHLGRWLRWTTEKGDRFPVERAVQIVLDVLAALEHAHDARANDGTPLSIVHRDVSPANVLVDVEGTVKLADFGIARMEGEHTVVDGSAPSVKGKFPYLPPEIFEGVAASAATDIYAAAVVLDEVLRGRNAFRTGQMAETLARVLEHVPEPLDGVRPDVSRELAGVVARAIDKTPENRYPTAVALASALRAARQVSPDQARSELTAAARADFHDPAIARVLDLPDLGDLENLWHGPAPEVQSDRPMDRTSIPTAPQGRARMAPTVRSRLAVGAGIGALGLVALGVTYALTRPPELDGGGAPLFVVVDRTARSDGGGTDAPSMRSAAAGSATADTGAPDAGPSVAAREEPTRPRPAGARSVEAPFRARAGEISRCFTTHVRELEGSPEIVVHFSVRADGSVQSASIAPSEVGGTALGRCILEVAESTRFAPGDAAVSFRVPLGARRVGG